MISEPCEQDKAEKAWEEYAKKHNIRVSSGNFYEHAKTLFEAGQKAKPNEVSIVESKAFTKSKGNVDFSLSEEESNKIHSKVLNKSCDDEEYDIDENLIKETAKYLSEREKGKQLDLARAERERVLKELESLSEFRYRDKGYKDSIHWLHIRGLINKIEGQEGSEGTPTLNGGV